MKRAGKTMIWALTSVLLATGARGVTSDTAGGPYSGIVARNVFNLHDPPKPVDPADLIKKEPPPKITLTGITTILGKKMTFLTIPAAKPGSPPESLTLSEGQAQDSIDVIQIDEKAGVVKVNNHGEPQTLDFDHDGAKPSGPATAVTQSSTTFPPRPAAPPANVLPSSPNGALTRPLRPFGQRNVPTSSRNGSAIQGALVPSGAAAAQDSTAMSPEETAALIVIQTEKMKAAGDSTYKIMPPISGLTAPEDPAAQ